MPVSNDGDSPTGDVPKASFNGLLDQFKLETSIRTTRSSTRRNAPTSSSKAKTITKVTKRTKVTKTKSTRDRKERENSAEAYRHLTGIPDNLGPNLILVFCGANPGLLSGTIGHAFSHPTNRFWKCLYQSGITPDRQLDPTEDVTLPEKYTLGRTDLVLRTSRLEDDIPAAEREDANRVFEAKIAENKPEAVCVVSKGTYATIYKAKHKKPLDSNKFVWGWQKGEVLGKCEGYAGAKVYVVPSTSGRVTAPSRPEQDEVWKKLGIWVNERRDARKEASSSSKTEE